MSTAGAAERGFGPLRLPSLAQIAAWFEDPHWGPLPQQDSGTAAGHSHLATAASTHAAGGAGHKAGAGVGQLPPYQPLAKLVKKGPSGRVERGFDARTSKRVASKSTATSTYYQNADGTFTRNLSETPVNYRDRSGNWQPIDTNLVAAPGGRWAEKANSVSVSVAGSAADASLVQIGVSGSASLSYGLSGAAPVAGTVSGSTIRYTGVEPSTDLTLQPTATGLRENLTLTSAAAGHTWTFPLNLTGLTAKQAADGSIQLRNAAGDIVGRIPAGYAYDSKINPVSGEPQSTHAITYRLVAAPGGGEQLMVTLDQAWLDDPARVFPVTVDPTSNFNDMVTTYVETTAADVGDHSMEPTIRIGSYNAGTNEANAFIAFPDSGLDYSGTTVTSATLDLFDVWSTTCTAERFDVAAVTQPWVASQLTTYPGPSYGASIGNATPSVPAACANTAGDLNSGNWVAVSLAPATFTSWAANGANDYGLAIYASNADSLHWKQFDSANSANSPSLSLTYSTYILPTINFEYPGNGSAEGTLTPVLSAVGGIDLNEEPAVSPKYDFQISDASGNKLADSGLITTTNWTVPSGKLAWGKSYYWTVQAYDGTNYSADNTWNSLTTVVPQPVITSSLSQNSGGHGFDGSIGNYTTSATDAQVSVVGPSLDVVRDYNSRDPRVTGAFGAAWSSILDSSVSERYDSTGAVQSVVVTYPDGSEVGFGKNSGSTIFSPPQGRFATLQSVTGGYTLTDKSDTVYTFTQSLGSGTYGLSSISDALGRSETFTWTSGHITVMDSVVSGRELHLTWSTPTAPNVAHVISVATDPVDAGQSATALTWTYTYTGDQLTKVCQPGTTTACTGYTYTGGSSYETAALDDGASSYWPLSETSGTSANDAVLANEGVENGTYNGTVTLNQPGGLSSGAGTATSAQFDGSTGYLTVPSLRLGSKPDFTISMWFQTTTANGVLFGASDNPLQATSTMGNFVPALYVGSDGKLNGLFFENINPTPIVSSAAVTDGKWHHVVLASAPNLQTMWLDGTQVGTQPGWSALGDNAFAPWLTAYDTFGAGYQGVNWPDEPHSTSSTEYATYFKGDLAGIAYFNRPLTQADVTALYTIGSHQANLMTGYSRPSGKAYAAIQYDAGTNTVNQVTDENGGVWKLAAPTVSGSSQVFRAAVLGAAPQDYYRLGDGAGASAPANEVHGAPAAYNAVTLGAVGPFTDETAATFNGSSSDLSLANGLLNGSTQSVGIWFKTSAANGVIVGTGGSQLTGTSSNYTPELYVGSDGKLAAEAWTGSAGPIYSKAAVNDGKWHYAVLSVAGTTQTLYLDGASQATKSGTVDMSGAHYDYVGAGWIGQTWPDDSLSGKTAAVQYFNGSLGEVSVYASALTGDQVAAQYNAARGSQGLLPVESVVTTDPGGKTITDRYDVDNGYRKLSETDGTGETTSYGYDTSGFLYTTTDPNGNVITTGHDVRGNVVSQTTCQNRSSGACSTAYYTFYPDDTTAQLTTADPRNDVMLTSRDGRSTSATDTTYETSYTYDAKGDKTAVTTPPVPGFSSGRTTAITYSDGTSAFPAADSGNVPAGLAVKTASPGGAVNAVAYFHNGDVAATTNAEGLVTSFTYDNIGRVLTRTVNPGTPVGWWKLNQASGTAVADSSGTGNAATASSSVSWNGTAAVFTGTAHQGVVASRPVLNTGASYSVSAWVDPTTASYQGTAVSECGINHCALYLEENSAGQWELDAAQSDASGTVTYPHVSTSSAVTLNTWTHLVGVYDQQSQTLTLYVNGALVGSTSFTTGWSAWSDFAIGGLAYGAQTVTGSGAIFQGQIANVEAYQQALSAAEVGSLYAAGTGGGSPVTASGAPSGVWSLTQPSGLTVADSSGAGNTATASASVSWTGSGAAFTGTAHQGVVANSAVLNTAASYSVSAWVDPTTASYQGTAVSQCGTNHCALYLEENSAGQWEFAAAQSDTAGTVAYSSVSTSSAVALNTWTHLVGVYDQQAQTMTLYANGALVGSTSFTTGWGAPADLAMGGLAYGAQTVTGSGAIFQGQIANVQAYQRVLSASEVSALYNDGRTGTRYAAAASAGQTTSYVYDVLDRIVFQTDPSTTDRVTGAVHTAQTTNTYDADGDLTQQVVADATGGDASRTTSNTYNAYDQVATATDLDNNQTSYSYDAYGNKQSETDPDGTITQWSYDADSHGLTQTVTNYTGSPLNPQPSASLVEWSKAYDPAGRLASVTDAMGNLTKYTYFDDNLTATVTKTDPTGANSFVTESDAYDAAGNQITKTTDNGATVENVAVDAADRTVSTTLDPTGADRTSTYAYTPDDQVATETQTNASGSTEVTAATYDGMGRATSQSTYQDGSGHPTGWWPLKQLSGTNVTDVSGTGNTATATHVSWTGNGASFPAATDQQIVTNGPVLNTAGSFTVGAWAYLTSSANWGDIVTQDGTQNSGFYLQYDLIDNAWAFSRVATDTANPTPIRLHASTAPTLNTWTFVLGEFDAGTNTMSLYVNGALVGTTTDATPFATNGSLAIGRGKYNAAAADEFAGQIADVQAYPRVLSATEISALYGAGSGGGTTASSTWATSSRSYDQRGLAVSSTDADGNTTDYGYDEVGNPTLTTAPTVSVETDGGTAVQERPTVAVGYNTFGEPVESQDANGNITTTVYDAAGNKVSQTRPNYTPPGSSTPITATTVWAYTKLNQVSSVTDPLLHATSYLYDQLGDVVQTTDPNNGTTDQTYDLNGQVTATTDPTGAQTQATYDWLGRPLTSTVLDRYPSPSTSVTQNSYAASAANPDGAFLASTTSQDGAAVSYTYDDLGEQTAVKDPAGHTTTTAYDFLGRPTTVTAADSTSTTTTYDALGDVVQTQQKDATGTVLATGSATYDAMGRTLSTTDARGNTSQFLYDATGELTQETQPVTATSSITTSFGYDANGDRTRYTDGRENAWIYTYNSWDLPESHIDPQTSTYNTAALSTFTTAYDADGRPVARDQPSGATLSLGYDNEGNLLSESGSGAGAATAARTFTYDGDGRVLTSGTAAAGTSGSAGYQAATSNTYTYDDRGELLTTSGSSGSSSFAYNGDGLMASRQDAAGTTAYGYNAADQLSTITDAATGVTASYTYNTLEQVSGIQYGTGGDARAYTYNSLHELTGDALSNGSTTVASISYGYDPNGNLTAKTTTGFDGSSANTYSYDFADRLTSWTSGTTTTNYSYDASGNRTQVGSNVYTYDARDELTGDGVNSYTYTADGTLEQESSSSGSEAFTSDAYGQQITVGTQSYTYDGSGRMISDAATGSSTAQTFAYTGAGNYLASDGASTYAWTPGNALIGIGAAAVGGGTTAGSGELAFVDQHTDVVGDFSPTGTALAGSTSYDPLGNVTATSGQAGSLGYQSAWTDRATGKADMAARWYSPATGQFMNKDTMALSPTPNSAAANPFAYDGDNPMIATDPTGHCFLGIACGLQSDVGSFVSSAANDVGNFASTAWTYTSDFASTMVNDTWSVASHVWGATESGFDDVLSAGERGLQELKAATSRLEHEVSNRIHDAWTWGKRQVKRVVAATVRTVVRVGAKVAAVVATNYHRVVNTAKKAAASAVTFVKNHAATIASLAAGAGTFLGCEALTAGIGSIGCAALAGAASGGVSYMMSCGKTKQGCSLTGAVEASVIGGIGGAVGGALAGPLGGKLAGEALDGLLPDVATNALVGAYAGGGAGAVTGAIGYAADCGGSQGGCSLSGLAGATAGGLAQGAMAGGVAGAGSSLLSKGLNSLRQCHSFSGDTGVLMADGSTKPIDQIKVGDKIANSVPGAKGTEDNTVTKVIVTKTDHDFVDVSIKPVAAGDADAPKAVHPAASTSAPAEPGASTKSRTLRKAAVGLAAALTALAATAYPATQPPSALAAPAAVAQPAATGPGGTLTTTFLHPFYDVTQSAFVEAQHLHVGDELQTPTGRAVITALHLYHADTVTYDLTIGALHTYYVVAGNTPVLVHNCGTETFGPNTYSWKHPESDSLFEAEVDGNGTMTMLAGVTKNSPVRGIDLFNRALNHFGDRVNAINGNLIEENRATFNELTAGDKTPEEAILQTWTGKVATRSGFGVLQSLKLIGEPGNYSKVEPIFTRS